MTLPAGEFLLRLLQHVWPRYQRDVHYFGLYQPSRRQAHTRAVARASRFGDQVLPLPPRSRRERLLQALAGRELRCPHCGGSLQVEHIEFPSRRHVRQTSRPPPATGQLALPV